MGILRIVQGAVLLPCCLAAKHHLPPGLRLLGASHFPNSQLPNANVGVDIGQARPIRCWHQHASKACLATPLLLHGIGCRRTSQHDPLVTTSLLAKTASVKKRKVAHASRGTKDRRKPPKLAKASIMQFRQNTPQKMPPAARTRAVHRPQSHCRSHDPFALQCKHQQQTRLAIINMHASRNLPKDVPETNKSSAFHESYAFFKKEGFPVNSRNNLPYGSTRFN